ncbi:two component response regulator receiver protein [Leptospira ryugenii]|uniref:Two component response regulator receiver protein n=1 Tax=Leptospira ryugenii TaxID=1917863 RepID=A0A2P2E130_9LEPT|nr:response regulator [Leptospira ryugenii]GBF50590.1 two component response regulator receiver protein [Leptospira ryugenii]
MSEYTFKPEILIIDDDSEICETLEVILNGLGYFVRYFTNPSQGLEYFERERNPIIFLDIHMPSFSGLDLLPKIKSIDEKTQVLMITGERDIQSFVSSLYHRATDFILKPFDLVGVESALKRAIHFYTLYKDKAIQEEAIFRDMKLASRIQQKSMTVPASIEKLSAEIIPLSYVSGDFFQILSLENNCSLVLMADIEGHGVTSALIAILMTTIHKEISKSAFVSTAHILQRLNLELCKEIGTHSMTAISLLVDHKNFKIKYSRGGHPFPLVFKRESIEVLPLHQNVGQILGILETANFIESELEVEAGDVLLMYTDGLLGSSAHPLIQTLSRLPSGPNRYFLMKKEINDYISYLKSSTKLQDDIAYVLLEI